MKLEKGIKRLKEKQREINKMATEIKFDIVNDFQIDESKYNKYFYSSQLENLGQQLFNYNNLLDQFITSIEAAIQLGENK